jgi:hypothetical protein
MVNLWTDLATAINNQIRLLHLASEPISVREIAASAFNLDFNNELDSPVASYDMKSRYAELFGGQGAYQYSRRDSLLAIRSYAQSEPQVARGIR